MKQDIKPLVSVYLPTKNRCSLIGRAILSVMNQDYPNIELIIVDDGSTDSTPECLSDFAKKYSNIKIYNYFIIDLRI